MAFKATSYRIKEGEEDKSKKSGFKATKYRSYDPDTVKTWETTNKQALDILNDYNNRINKSEWLDEEDRKKYRSALDTYIDTTNRLRGLNKTFGDGYSDEDEQKWTDAITSMNKGYDEISNLFSKYASGDAYKKAMDDAAAWQKDYEKLMRYDLEKGKRELDSLTHILGYNDEITQLKNDIAILKQVKSDPFGTHRQEREAKEQRLAYLESVLQEHGGADALKAMVSEYNAYFNRAKRAQDGARLGGVSNPESEYYDPNFEEYSKLGNDAWWENIGGKTNQNGMTIYDDLKAATLVMNERWLGKELFSEDMATPKSGISGYIEGLLGLSQYNSENIDTVNIFREMEDDEIATLAYYLQKDKENGTNLAEQYVTSIRETLNARMGEKIAGTKDNIASQLLFAVEAGIDQYFEGRDALFSNADYIPTSATQYASGNVRDNLIGKGVPLWYNFKDNKWENEILGSSTSQIAYDALNTTANMLPSTLASVAVNFALPGAGVGSKVGLGLLGVSAAGNAKAEMLKLGYSKEQANTYGILAGASEAVLEAALGGIPGLKGADGIFSSLGAKAIGKIDNALARAAITIGGNMLDEGLEEGLQTIIEPWLKEIATSVDWESASIDEVLYSSLLGAISSIGFTGADMLGNKINSNSELRETGQSIIDESGQGGIDALKQIGSEVYTDKGLAEDKKGIQLVEKVNKNASAKNVGKLATYIESTTAIKNETTLTKALTEKGLSAKVATKVAKYIMDSTELSKADVATIEGSKRIQQVINEVLEDSNLDISDASIRLQKAMIENKSTTASEASAGQAEIDSVTENTPASENAVKGDSKRSVAKAIMTDSEGNEVEVKPQRFVSTESGEMGIEIEDGQVVNATEVDFGNSGMGLVRQAAVDMSSRVGGFGVDTANVFVKGYNESSGQIAGSYINGWISAYKFGAQNSPISVLESNKVTSALTKEQRKTAYNFGRAFGNEAVTKEKVAGAENATTTKNKKGRVIFDGKVYGKNISERQRASLKALNFLAKALGIDIYVEELDGANGWYDPKDRSIHVDIDAGVRKEDALLLFTTSHELTHDIRATLPEKFNTLADAVFEEYNKRFGEHTWEDLIKNKIDFLEKKGDITEEMTEEEAYDIAYEEVICDCLETMLVDSDAMTALSKNIYAKDKTLWQRIRDFFTGLVERIRAAYADAVPDSEEGQRFRDLGEGAERIKNLWVEAIVELSEVDKTTGEGKVKHSYSSIAYSFFGDENISIKDMESGAYKKTEGYKRYVEQCLNNMRQSVEGFSEKAALKEIRNSIDGIVEVAVAMKKTGYDILDSEGGRNVRDSKKRLLFSSLEPNSDYFTSSDISTICDKRINFAEIYDEIVRREDAMGVPKSKRFFNNIDNYFVLHKILADKGLTAPCRQCYVESMRKNLDPMANAFIELMQETDPNNKANKQLYQPSGKNKGELKSNNAKIRENLLEVIEREQYDITADKLTIKMLTTADGLAQLKLQAPLIYEAFNSFYGQSKPKMPKQATPFRFGELTALLTDDKGKIKTGLIKQIMSTGGFRLQSYSDFQIQNFADVLQVIFEAGTLGLNGHAYTKVPAFLDATKGTNLKRNISIFMYKDEGQWKIDRGDSFPYELEDIYNIVDADESGNTGIIAVVQNEDMAAWIMANNNIGYFIPFHKSGVKMGVVRETIVREGGREIKGYSGIKDHTRQQTEVWAKSTADHKANTKVKKGINIYEFWDFDNVDNLSQKELIEKNVMAYIDACNEAGYLPKFREYVMDNGKVLNKVLAYAKELGFVSQDATIEDISFEYSGYRIPYGYYKCLGDFGMFTPDGEASPIERLSLKDYNFKEAVKFFSDAETLRRNEILQQFENGFEREKYRNSDMTTAELAEEVQKRRNQVVDDVVSGEYKNVKHSHKASEKASYSDRDSLGNVLSKEQQEFFRDSKVRDEKGNLQVLYHGTTVNFDIFKKGDVGFHFGTKGAARGRVGFGKNTILKEVYLNITNPIVFDEDLGSWDADFRLTRELYDRGILTRTEAESILFTDDRMYKRTTEKANKRLASVLLEKGYDGIAYSNTFETKKPTTSYIIFNSNQAKEITNTTPTENPNIRYSHRADKKATYSYESLTSKPDMKLTMVGDNVPTNRADIVAEAKKNAAKVGKFNPKDGSVSVHVEDVGADVLLGTDGLKHGLRRSKDLRDNDNAIVTVKAGEILKNSIRINELVPSKVNATGSYVLMGAATNANGDLYIVRSVVNQFNNELTAMDVLYAMNAKKEELAALNAPRSTAMPLSVTNSTISIAQLLDFVNSYFPDILPDSVLRHYGHTERPKGKLGESVLYQNRATNGMKPRTLLANALETVAQNDIERNKLKEYKSKISLIEAEQVKLSELRAKIKELSFATGQRDTEALKKLQFEANQTANRINTYDRQLLNLESTKALKGVLEREKELARKRAEQKAEERRKADIARVKERAAKTERELMNRYQESREKAREGREKTDMRHKIKDVVNELNQYLTKGTKEKHVPIELQKAVAEALNAVNMDTVGAEERIAKKRAEMMVAKSPEVVERLAKEIAHIEEMGGNMAKKISRLKTAYDSIINSDDPLIANSHDDVITNTIDRVLEVVGETPLRDMSLYQLEAVYDMYRMVLTSVRNANKAFKAAKGEEISTIANGVIAELMDKKRKSPYSTKGKQAMSEFDWNNYKPVYAFERIGSANFTKVFNAVRAGEDVWANDMSEAQAFRKEQFKKYKRDSWDFKKRYGFTSTSGMRFELTLDQMLSLYAFSKREQAGDHLKNGGFVFDGLTEVKVKNKVGVTVTYQLKDATAYNLSEETLGEIIDKLTPEQKAFADAMQDYLSTVMGEKGNEVSLALYDIKLFKEKHYFPLKSAPQYMAKAKEQAQGEVKIKNSGFTKETTPKAKNPIVLSSFMDVWAGHVNEMSMYHAFTLPLEDFYRVYNYHTPADAKMEMVSVGASLENAHGQASVKYIDQLLKDLNGGARSDPRETLGKSLMSNFKKASVMASFSVVVQQPTAMVRAMALVDAKYFVGQKVAKGKHKEMWAEVKKYAPVAVIKEMGYFDTGMGKGSVEWLKGEKTFKDKLDDATSKLPALADEATWVAIWNAVKRETVHTHKNLRPNSEEFLKVVGERFTEVIVKTQVYDSTLSRSANMRSKSGLMNMWTAFMAEPTTSINMLQDAFRKGNKKYTARAICAVYGSVILNSALVSIIYAMRDDDEDETFMEKYLSRLTTEVIDGINPITYIPFFKDIWSLAQGFDVERADMSLINDAIDSLQQAVKVIIKDTSSMDEDELAEHRKAVNEAMLSITDNLSSLVGVPVKNVRRDLNGVINAFKTIGKDVSGRETTAGSLSDNILEDVKDSIPVWGWFPDESKGDKLYDAIIKEDTAYVDRLKGAYKDDKAFSSAIRKALRENDPRIKEAAEALNNGNFSKYSDILNEIVGEENFAFKDIKAAILTEFDNMTPEE